jgi:uncharacterized protein (DUF1499 family)
MIKILLPLILLSFFTSCSSPRPKDLGLIQKENTKVLKKCPESPNCINSHFPQDKDHFLDPLKYETSKEDAKKLLIQILKNTSHVKIITDEPNYVHAEFTSSLFKFVDDVEFNLHQPGLIHFKSASRLGYSDLGANKKRMSQISFRFYQNDM